MVSDDLEKEIAHMQGLADCYFGNMEGASGDEFTKWSDLYVAARRILEAMKLELDIEKGKFL